MKVKVDYPNKPKGATVDVPGLGSFENGTTSEVTDNQWERFLNRYPAAREALGDNKTQATIPFSDEPAKTKTTAATTSDKE